MITEEKDEHLQRKKLAQKKHYLKYRDEILKRKKEARDSMKVTGNNLISTVKKEKEIIEDEMLVRAKSKTEVMAVLRKFPKSNLWNKEIENWSELNWIEFNKLKNS